MGQQPDVPHWLKYVRWDVISRWRSRAKAAEGEMRYPYAFASRERAFPNINGGVLWLMSSPRYGTYRQPPSMIARLEVTDVVASGDPKADHVDVEVRNFGPWVAIATERSDAYLPLNNVSPILEKLRFQGRVKRLPETPRLPPGTSLDKRPYSHIPQHFQSHRVISPGSVHHLEEFATAVQLGRRVFVSYRWRDFPDTWLQELTAILGDHTVSCWLDKRNVPQTSTADYGEGLLRNILDDAIRQSAWFVALMRPGYTEDPEMGIPPWVRHEWDEAGKANARSRRDRMHRVAVLFGEQPRARDWIDPNRDEVITVHPEASARTVAQELHDLLPALSIAN